MRVSDVLDAVKRWEDMEMYWTHIRKVVIQSCSNRWSNWQGVKEETTRKVGLHRLGRLRLFDFGLDSQKLNCSAKQWARREDNDDNAWFLLLKSVRKMFPNHDSYLDLEIEGDRGIIYLGLEISSSILLQGGVPLRPYKKYLLTCIKLFIKLYPNGQSNLMPINISFISSGLQHGETPSRQLQPIKWLKKNCILNLSKFTKNIYYNAQL